MMAGLTDRFFKTFRQDWLFTLCLSITLSFFIYKGIQYAMIGSYVPPLFIFMMLALLIFSLNRSLKAFKRSVAFWSVLIILWSAARLLLGATNEFVKPVPEGHIDGQLGPMSMLFSVAFLFAGIYIWKNRKRLTPEIEG